MSSRIGASAQCVSWMPQYSLRALAEGQAQRRLVAERVDPDRRLAVAGVEVRRALQQRRVLEREGQALAQLEQRRASRGRVAAHVRRLPRRGRSGHDRRERRRGRSSRRSRSAAPRSASARIRAGSGSTSALPISLETCCAATFPFAAARVVVDLRVEVVPVRRVRRLAVRRRDGDVALLPEQVARVPGRARDAVAVQHGQRHLPRRDRALPRRELAPERPAVAVEASPTSGLRNCCTASVMLLCRVASSFWPKMSWIFTWKTWPCGRL